MSNASHRTDFYKSREWLNIRDEALARYGDKCERCRRGKRDGVMLHVDHIQPRSKYPHLALRLNNLQVLCDGCNIGKSNKVRANPRFAVSAELETLMMKQMGRISAAPAMPIDPPAITGIPPEWPEEKSQPIPKVIVVSEAKRTSGWPKGRSRKRRRGLRSLPPFIFTRLSWRVKTEGV